MDEGIVEMITAWGLLLWVCFWGMGIVGCFGCGDVMVGCGGRAACGSGSLLLFEYVRFEWLVLSKLCL